MEEMADRIYAEVMAAAATMRYVPEDIDIHAVRDTVKRRLRAEGHYHRTRVIDRVVSVWLVDSDGRDLPHPNPPPIPDEIFD